MNIERCLRAGLVPCVALAVLTTAANAQDAYEDVVDEWNLLLQQNGPPAPPFRNSRVYAMMHIAMFDAINAIEGGYEPYRTEIPASSGASAIAAGAQAAHDILVAMVPDAAATFDAALAARLEQISEGRRMQSVEVGMQAAQAVLEWRADDGFDAPNPEYVLPPLPGLWQPTAEGQVAAFANAGDVVPFALVTPSQYLPVRQPELTSAEYAEDFNEVKELGSATSATRTAEETDTAQRWAVLTTSTTPFAVWSNVARDVADQQAFSLGAKARVLALMHAAIQDGLLTSQSSKFVYGLWRPVTAIRMADTDLNDATEADPAWEPLLPTPPYPSHASNMQCIGAAAAQALTRLFDGGDIPITVNWGAIPDSGGSDFEKSYQSFKELSDEEGRSRVLGGIHFTFELEASNESCTQVGDYVVDNYALPISP